jgi:hypothetical protein
MVGTVLKTYRLPRQCIDVEEPLIDVRVGPHIVTVCSIRDGFLYRLNVQVGSTVRAGQIVAVVGGLRAYETHEIFVAYRRNDSMGHAGRIGELLRRTFGRWQVFQDIDSLPPGRGFVEQVRTALARMLVMVVVVGPHWLGEPGARRVDDAGDLHREEIRVALQRGVPIFPVLVEGARMPRENDLPEDISRFSRIQALELSDSRWEHDTGLFVQALSDRLTTVGDRTDPHANL